MPRMISRLAALALSWASVCSAAPAQPAVPLPSARDEASNFFRSPDFTAPAVSPDGKSVAFIAWQNGHSRLFRLDLTTGKMGGVFDPGQGEVVQFWWMGSKRVLIAALGEFGYQYFAQDLAGGKAREIKALGSTPPGRVNALPDDPEHVMAIVRGPHPYVYELLLNRINLSTDRSELVDSNVDDPNGMLFSAQGEVRAKAYQIGDHWKIFWRASAAGSWHDLDGHGDEPPFWPLAVAANDHDLFVVGNDQGDTTALMSLDPDTGRRTLVAQRPERDISRLIPRTPFGYPAGLSFFHPGQEDLQFLDAEDGNLHAGLARSLPEMHRRIASSSLDRTVRIIETWNPGQPSRYYLFDAAHHRLSKLGEQFDDNSLPRLGTVQFFAYTTRDGVKESGYILFPHSSRATKPYPLLLIPANYLGEEGQLADGFDGLEQYFASRGIAVARFVVRGSRGLGNAFQQAGEFKLANVVAQDYEDGLQYLTREGLIDPRRVGIMGWELQALFALRMASISTAFKAVVAQDATAASLTTAYVAELTGRGGGLHKLIEQAGGTKAAYSLVHDFEPGQYLGHLSAKPLIIYSSEFELEIYAEDAGALRASLDGHKKSYEWYRWDLHEMETQPWAHLLEVLYTRIGDYLVKTLEVAPAPAAAGK